MTLIQIIVLAIVQGLTEFLPISSSGHLILVPQLTDWPDQGLAFDVAVHVGTLSAVVFYFRQDLTEMLLAWLKSIPVAEQTPESRLAWAIIIGSIPVGVGGLLLHDLADTVFRSPLVIAWATIGFGVLLGIADWFTPRQRELTTLTWTGALWIGIAQVLALIPGTSRSGITMTAGLLLGFTRQAAARFSFLLSIPAILMAGGYKSIKLLELPEVDWLSISLGIVLSAITAYLCIHYFLKLLDKMGMLPFVVYRIILGVILLYVFW
ncbi:MAG: undecaprenyl-diphosphate phosphatase [Thioalkalispiraceae bacterium]|jgi:undecaprenyl-diphosphatase